MDLRGATSKERQGRKNGGRAKEGGEGRGGQENKGMGLRPLNLTSGYGPDCVQSLTSLYVACLEF